MKKPVSLGRSSVNPFASQTPEPTPLEWLKILLVFPTLGVLRVILLVLVIGLASAWAKVVLLGHTRTATNTLPAWRVALLLPCRITARAILFILGFYVIDVAGAPAPPTLAPFLLPNHVCIMEPLFFTWYGVSHVSMAEVANLPAVGALFAAFDTLFVNRVVKKSCDDMKEALNRRAEKPGAWPTLCLYPEGTTSNGRGLLSFKLGAFVPGVPVQPVVVQYRFSSFDPCWTDNTRLYFVRFLSQFVHHMSVTFLPVMAPTADERADPALFAARVRAVMAAALNVVPTEHSRVDVLLQITAQRARLPRAVGVVESGKLQRLLRVTDDDLQQYLRKFASVNHDKSGQLTVADLQRALGMEAAPTLAAKLFALFDQDQSGTIDFREFVAGLVFLNTVVGDEATVGMATRVLDADGSGAITRAGFTAAVRGNASEPLSDATLDGLFDGIDTGAMGVVSRDQVAAFLRAHMGIFTAPRKTQLLERFKFRLGADFEESILSS